MSYAVNVPKAVGKQLDKLPTDVRERLVEKILLLTDDARPDGVKKLKGSESEYRLRVGNYRIRYEIDDEALSITILSCRHRKESYRNK
ncbi:type II toxin-antitoxin system RelE family toxin [Leptolyngbya sp. NIES-2104]|uniref:type II toxin-antitoxin system RelE family toxin n=1 Tax=Leptolyngbya sp. NIES-2104 TaxID=1552121 RepID=UPI00073EAA78|nr:type II toxin-antitoxin system RelE/ParE family toxin [Leptolyngbya sp. NIES-2104]